MKTTKKPSHGHVRYLTKKEFKDPLYAIADFCVNTINHSVAENPAPDAADDDA